MNAVPIAMLDGYTTGLVQFLKNATMLAKAVHGPSIQFDIHFPEAGVPTLNIQLTTVFVPGDLLVIMFSSQVDVPFGATSIVSNGSSASLNQSLPHKIHDQGSLLGGAPTFLASSLSHWTEVLQTMLLAWQPCNWQAHKHLTTGWKLVTVADS